MFLVAGLGNPEERYAATRHNAGFEVVRALARRIDAPPWRNRFHGQVARGKLGAAEALLLLPMTFMNDSGRSVGAARSFFRVPVAELVVVHDELDLVPGTLRFKVGGGHAGHNGLRSIAEELGSGDFVRLRVGIGHPPKGWTRDVADYVLSDMDPMERQEFPATVDRAVKALIDLGTRGVAAATNALNTRARGKKGPSSALRQDEAHDDEGVATDDD